MLTAGRLHAYSSTDGGSNGTGIGIAATVVARGADGDTVPTAALLGRCSRVRIDDHGTLRT